MDWFFNLPWYSMLMLAFGVWALFTGSFAWLFDRFGPEDLFYEGSVEDDEVVAMLAATTAASAASQSSSTHTHCH